MVDKWHYFSDKNSWLETQTLVLVLIKKKKQINIIIIVFHGLLSFSRICRSNSSHNIYNSMGLKFDGWAEGRGAKWCRAEISELLLSFHISSTQFRGMFRVVVLLKRKTFTSKTLSIWHSMTDECLVAVREANFRNEKQLSEALQTARRGIPRVKRSWNFSTESQKFAQLRIKVRGGYTDENRL